MKKAINRKALEASVIADYCKATKKVVNTIDAAGASVSISKDNRKMNGDGCIIPSVSISPVLTCSNCSQCSKYCYALKMARLRSNVNKSWAKNLAIYRADPEKYFSQIDKAAKFSRYFRWHVSGDIIDAKYFAGMLKIAQDNPHTEFLAFTKNYSVVNNYIDNGGTIPANLHLIFSGWVGLKMDNPHNLPTSHPIFSDGTTSAPDGAKWCGGNCAECAMAGAGCWTMQRGDAVIFALH